jgi:hypothetical protein
MTSKHFVTLGLVVGGLSVLGVAGIGCGNSTATSTTTAGTGGSTSSTTSSQASTTSSTSATTGTGGTMGGGNHTPDTANDIGVGAMATDATLQDPLTPDYYKFTGVKGDRMIITADAQRLISGSTNLNDPTVVDTVVTLLDSTQKVIAEDDDEFPRNSTDSQLFVELPASGDYYIKVEDCNSYAASHPGVGCAPAGMITTLDYQIFAAKLNDTNAGTAQDGTAAKAVAVTYTGVTNMTGSYQEVVIDGNFKSTTDKHVFTFTPPANLAMNADVRSRGVFWVQPPTTTDGDGSTANIKLWVTDDMAGTHVIASADQNNYHNGDDQVNGPLELSFPLDTAMLAKPYYLFVENTATTSKPDSDYYFILHTIDSPFFGQVELEGVLASGINDTMATAQALKVPAMDVGAYFADAQLGVAGDVDWFSMAVPALVTSSTMTMVAPDHLEFDCDVARAGSGLTGFTAQVLAADGTTVIATNGPEGLNPKVEMHKGGDGMLALPASNAGKTTFLKVSATGQDATNKGSYYHCNVFFFTTK